MSFPKFDRSLLKILPLEERVSDVYVDELARLDDPVPDYLEEDIPEIAKRILKSREQGHPVIWMMGAHVIKSGLAPYVIDLMERGLVTGVALNGAGCIHDFELAMHGATSESVARYISEGQFGLWRETGKLNELAAIAHRQDIGFGEAVGQYIVQEKLPHADISILAAGYRLHIPVTIHVSIGYDIIHEHPNCDGAALGAASYNDFLVFAQQITDLEGGVFMSMGTAVMGPEVYLKSLSMARNVAFAKNQPLNHFTTAVFDLQDLGPDISSEADKTDAKYYFRPFKTILVRTVRDGGESFYVRQNHKVSVPVLHKCLTQEPR